MRIFQIISPLLLLFFVVYYIAGDNIEDPGQVEDCACECVPPSGGSFVAKDSLGRPYPAINEALLASRFNSLEELKAVIQIEYLNPPSSVDSAEGYSAVYLRQCSNGLEVTSVLESGISQGDIMSVKRDDYGERLWLLATSPFAVANRLDLYKVFSLARRKPHLFGEGDVAFYDLAETSANNISTEELAYRHPRDSSEKGYINAFNHITAQAFITSFFSEELADFLADVHERHHMPELTTGKFTEEQLTNIDNNPVDNYVDMINNEWGQELGKKLKVKYNIDQETYWTPELLADYLNDLQQYYSWAFQIGLAPYSSTDDVVLRFAYKINEVMEFKEL